MRNNDVLFSTTSYIKPCAIVYTAPLEIDPNISNAKRKNYKYAGSPNIEGLVRFLYVAQKGAPTPPLNSKSYPSEHPWFFFIHPPCPSL